MKYDHESFIFWVIGSFWSNGGVIVLLILSDKEFGIYLTLYYLYLLK